MPLESLTRRKFPGHSAHVYARSNIRVLLALNSAPEAVLNKCATAIASIFTTCLVGVHWTRELKPTSNATRAVDTSSQRTTARTGTNSYTSNTNIVSRLYTYLKTALFRSVYYLTSFSAPGRLEQRSCSRATLLAWRKVCPFLKSRNKATRSQGLVKFGAVKSARRYPNARPCRKRRHDSLRISQALKIRGESIVSRGKAGWG